MHEDGGFHPPYRIRDSPGEIRPCWPAHDENQRERRGIVLVLVLGMLGLMAVIGITFATFTGQSRISARNFAQSVNQPQRDELMDYALSQLISDTTDIRSAIRGHSLARDMYGNDANFNGYLTSRPDGAYMPPEQRPATSTSPSVAVAGRHAQFNLPTNIPRGRPRVLRLQLHALDHAGLVPRPVTAAPASRRPDARDPGRQRVQRHARPIPAGSRSTSA